jgi:hypothetical protein
MQKIKGLRRIEPEDSGSIHFPTPGKSAGDIARANQHLADKAALRAARSTPLAPITKSGAPRTSGDSLRDNAA